MPCLAPKSRLLILLPAALSACCSMLCAQQIGDAPDQPSSSAQASLAAAPLPSIRPQARVETSVSLGADAQLTAARISTQQSFDPSAGVTAAFRQSFKPWLGYSVNLGYTRTTGHNGYSNGYQELSFDIPANMYELSLSYLAQKRISPKLTGFVDLGAGMVSFLPVHRGADAANYVPGHLPRLVPPVTFRPLGVAGFGADYHFTPKLAIRAEYRGLLYKAPDYGINLGKPIVVSNQPTLSVVYTFGHKR